MVSTDAEVNVRANTTQARRSLNALSQAFYIAGNSASRLGTVTRASLMGIAVGGAAFAGVKIGQLAIQATKDFIAFNDTLARTGAILGANKSDLQDLEGEIRRIGMTTRFTAEQAGEAANKLAIAGVGADEMIDDRVLEKLVKFAIAGGVDIQTATDIGIAGVKAFGMEMSELDSVSDVLTRTFTRSNVSIISLGEGLKFVAPVAYAAGISIEETAAAIGALGNAGLRGTIAGTGLRMAINKLLKPTFDATRAMDDLGMNVVNLTPAGQTAKNTLRTLTVELDRTTLQASALKREVSDLDDAMSDLSIQQQRNSLAVAQIRQRASRANRDLTEQEIQQIKKLEESSEDLQIKEQELSIERTIQGKKLSKSIEKEKELKNTSTDLIRTVEQQTKGVVSFGEVLDQLAESGATTTQILEIFGVRGGTAIASLVSQRSSFHELVQLNEDAAGATDDYTDSLQRSVEEGGSAMEHLLVVMSKIKEGMITIGEPIAKLLVDMGELFGDDLQQALVDLSPHLQALAQDIAFFGAMALPLIIDAMPDVIELMRALTPIITVLAMAFRILMAYIAPFAQVINGIFRTIRGIIEAVMNIKEGKWSDAAASLVDGFKEGGTDILKGGLGIGIGMAGGNIAKGLSGATRGGASTFGGVLAQGSKGSYYSGAGSANAMLPEFHMGGIIKNFTAMTAGERGPEAIIPLGGSSKDTMNRNRVMGEAGLSGSGGGNVSIQNMNVSTNISKHELKEMVKTAFSQVINESKRRGGRGF